MTEIKDPHIWFHWSPTSRRKSIQRSGLLPGSHATDKLWKPPYICLAESPRLAWELSGKTARGQLHAEWDLWEVWCHDLGGYEGLYFDNGRIKEVRVYERIYKRDVWLIGSRSNA